MFEQHSNRRRETRIAHSCPVLIRGMSALGMKIRGYGITANISSGGMLVKPDHHWHEESSVFAFIQLPNNVRIAATGKVLRSDSWGMQPDCIAVQFRKTRLLPAA